MPHTDRTYPAFPIPATGAIILDAGYVLLVQRGQPPAKGKWTIPGGVIEVGESPEEALVREVREECHVDVTVQQIVTVVNRVFRDEEGAIEYHYIILDYLARCQQIGIGKQTPIHADSDVMNVRWVPLQELDQYDLTEDLSEVIQAAVIMNNRLSLQVCK